MKGVLLAIPLLGLGAIGAYQTPPSTLRVLTYNIHHGEGTDGVFDLPRIADVIRSVEPDLVALQEVDQGHVVVAGKSRADLVTHLLDARDDGRVLPGSLVGQAQLVVDGRDPSARDKATHNVVNHMRRIESPQRLNELSLAAGAPRQRRQHLPSAPVQRESDQCTVESGVESGIGFLQPPADRAGQCRVGSAGLGIGLVHHP